MWGHNKFLPSPNYERGTEQWKKRYGQQANYAAVFVWRIACASSCPQTLTVSKSTNGNTIFGILTQGLAWFRDYEDELTR
jgi:hypothetical protein